MTPSLCALPKLARNYTRSLDCVLTGRGRTRVAGLRLGEGFLGALPNLDWSATLILDDSGSWLIPPNDPTKRFSSVRLAIPARSARHKQAAVHAIWSAGTLTPRRKRTVYYGFRKLDSTWKLVARDAFGEDSIPTDEA